MCGCAFVDEETTLKSHVSVTESSTTSMTTTKMLIETTETTSTTTKLLPDEILSTSENQIVSEKLKKKGNTSLSDSLFSGPKCRSLFGQMESCGFIEFLLLLSLLVNVALLILPLFLGVIQKGWHEALLKRLATTQKEEKERDKRTDKKEEKEKTDANSDLSFHTATA